MTDMHARLGELADEMADGTDLRTQADGARARHRRARRTRLGLAGAAVAVALVAVGVPIVIGTSSAPERSDPVAPALPTEGPAGAAQRLGDFTRQATSSLFRYDLTGSTIGAAPEAPCPDLTVELVAGAGQPVHGPLGDGVPLARDGCTWSTSPDLSGSPADRLDLSARFTAGTTAEDLVDRLDRDVEVGCEWIAVLDGGTFDALQFCPADEGIVRWTMLLETEDGAGSWELTASIGEGYSTQGEEGFGVSDVGSMWAGIGLWSLVESGASDVDEGLVQAQRDLRHEFLGTGNGPVPEPPLDAPCPDVSDRLRAGAWAVGRVQGSGTMLTGADGCNWSSDPRGGTPDAERYDLRLTARPELTAAEVTDLVETRAGNCPFADAMPGEDFVAVFSRCDQAEQVFWNLIVVDEDGTGAWDMIVAVRKEDEKPGGVHRAYQAGLSGLSSLWDVVRNVLPAEDAPPVDNPIADEFARVAAALAAQEPPFELRAGSSTPGCPSSSAELDAAVGDEVAFTSDATSDQALSCNFLEGLVWLGVSYTPVWSEDVIAVQHDDRTARTTRINESPAEGPVTVCSSSEIAGTPQRTTLHACTGPEGAEWSLVVTDAGGRGVWVVDADLLPTVENQSEVVLALAAAVDEAY